jgi:plastocyanin
VLVDEEDREWVKVPAPEPSAAAPWTSGRHLLLIPRQSFERNESMTPEPSATQRRNALKILVAFLTALLLPLALTGGALTYSHHHHHHHRTWTVLVGEESHDHAIQGMAYLPRNIYINRHDTIRWKANAAEIHTVTFLAKGQKLTPFNPGDPLQTGRVGGHAYDGKHYYNSGLLSNMTDPLFPTTDHYSLRFNKTGTFTYWCLVHGKVMKGTVHVRPVGTHYPFTQRQYYRQGVKKTHWILRHGYHLWHETAERATNHLVFAGNDDAVAMVMRFIRPTVWVHVGQKVTWRNIGMQAPHTVTFGEEPKGLPNLFGPSHDALGDPADYRGGSLHSGIMEPGAKFVVTFAKAGTFHYICALHDGMGMVGKVVVKP